MADDQRQGPPKTRDENIQRGYDAGRVQVWNAIEQRWEESEKCVAHQACPDNAANQ